MSQLINTVHYFLLGIVNVDKVIKPFFNDDKDTFIDGGAEDNPAVLAIEIRKVGPSSAKAYPQRGLHYYQTWYSLVIIKPFCGSLSLARKMRVYYCFDQHISHDQLAMPNVHIIANLLPFVNPLYTDIPLLNGMTTALEDFTVF